MTGPEPLRGLDLAALTTWLDAERPGLRQGPLTASRITGGFSNLTYRVDDDVHRWAVRRPPLSHVLPTAHDMSREFRIISALAPTTVPVAGPVAMCEDPEVMGAPFYVMDFVDGAVLDRPEVLADLDADAAARACAVLVDVLLDLHSLDPAEVGLATLGRPEGFLERQVRRWTSQWEASQTQERPQLRPLVEGLAANVPTQSPAGVVHGDYRLTNVIYDHPVETIAAVVDWEMATVGDPLADLGLMAVYQELSNVGGFVMPSLGTDRGFWTPQQMIDRYAAGTDRDLDALDWYLAFSWFKLAVISEGIHARFLQGQTVGDGFDRIGATVPGHLDAGLAALRR